MTPRAEIEPLSPYPVRVVIDPERYPYDFREIVALCEIGEDELGSLDPSNRMAAGLMMRSAHLLSAADAMVEEGHPDVCGVLLRPVIDGVVTAFWLLDDLETNIAIFMGEHLRNLRRLASWNEADDERVLDLDFYESLCRRWGVDPVETDMPRMATRAASLWSEIRPLYKEVSAQLHATVASADLALMLPSREDVARDPYLFAPQDWLAQAAYLTLALAKRLHDLHDWDGRVDVTELFEDLKGWRPRRRRRAT